MELGIFLAKSLSNRGSLVIAHVLLWKGGGVPCSSKRLGNAEQALCVLTTLQIRRDTMFKRLFAFIVGLVLLGGFAVAEAGGKRGELVLRVATDLSTFDSPAPAPGEGQSSTSAALSAQTRTFLRIAIL